VGKIVFSRRVFAAGALSLIAGSARGLSAAARERFAWPEGARAAVSLTYDDGLDSQIDFAAPDLQAAGLKATFFLTQENMEERLSDWQAVWRSGHEVGNHSVTHPCRLRSCTSDGFGDAEVAPMEAFLDSNFTPDRFRSYAYPCGFIGLGEGGLHQRIARYEHALRGRIAAARTVSGLANDPLRAVQDPFLLHAYEPTYDVDDPRLAFRYVDRTVAAGGWAILVFHDVVGRRKGFGDTSQGSHRAILRWLTDQPIWCAPLGEVFQYIQARNAGPTLGRSADLAI
jgi:hypothetical protein